MSEILGKWKKGLAKSNQNLINRLNELFQKDRGDNLYEELEAILFQADLGVSVVESLIESLKKEGKRNFHDIAEIKPILKKELLSHLTFPPPLAMGCSPWVIMVVGVNGSGKTTTIAKLSRRYKMAGKKVFLLGADTFRAAAEDQLQIWGDRLSIPVFSGKKGTDPGSVVYDGINSALAKDYDLVLIDTAGRMHTRHNLMEEIKKVYRVAGSRINGAPQDIWLVMDAFTGQNAIAQAKEFKKEIPVTGIILTKMDTSAHGGMAFTLQEELNLPIRFIGLGESVDDLEPFDRDRYVDGILGDLDG